MYSSKSGNGFYRASFFCSALSLEVHIVESFDVETVFVGYTLPRSHSFTPSSFFSRLKQSCTFCRFQTIRICVIPSNTMPYRPIWSHTLLYCSIHSCTVSVGLTQTYITFNPFMQPHTFLYNSIFPNKVPLIPILFQISYIYLSISFHLIPHYGI